MKILLLGSKGMLGSDCRSVLSQNYEILSPDKKELDIVSWGKVIDRMHHLHPEIVLNCAAITDPDVCEETRQSYMVKKVNVEGPRNIAQASARYDCKVIQISSDQVFNGEKAIPQPYFEDDTLDPLSAYGRSKMESETAVRENASDYMIVRSGWLYGHLVLASRQADEGSAEALAYMKEGLEKLARRGAANPFLFGVPFIWCSNNLVVAALTQLRAYCLMTHDTPYAEMEAALRDWLFGCNPWGTSMIVGYPREGDTPVDPHSAFTHLYGYPIDGGLVDGPFAAANLIGVRLQDPDEYAEFQSRLVVYHDDMGDYSTNEPTMDGTASLTYYLSSMEMDGRGSEPGGEPILSHGGIVRMDPSKREIFLAFTGHELSDGGTTIRESLHRHGIRASFFVLTTACAQMRFSAGTNRQPQYAMVFAGEHQLIMQ